MLLTLMPSGASSSAMILARLMRADSVVFVDRQPGSTGLSSEDRDDEQNDSRRPLPHQRDGYPTESHVGMEVDLENFLPISELWPYPGPGCYP